MVASSRRALIALAALCLVLPAVALGGRITVHFLATFDLQGAPGEPPPLAADSGVISVSGMGFSVVPTPGGGGALLVQGMGLPMDVKLHGEFKKDFKGSELVVNWSIRPNQTTSCLTLRCAEDSDGEIIDADWDGGGVVLIDGTPVNTYSEGETSACTLTLRDNSIGPDLWIFTMTKLGGVPVTSSGPLVLAKPLAVCALDVIVPAGSMGSFVLDDLQATSTDYKSK
ncbi:MAG TPA: hypothetical protein VFY71_01635 [Planctomycetota bacterium]|nr:hypothetical protein [Planctomycetota bacterium]